MQVVGHRTFDEPCKPVAEVLMPPEAWVPLNVIITIFFASMPSGGYAMLKNIEKHWSHLGFDAV